MNVQTRISKLTAHSGVRYFEIANAPITLTESAWSDTTYHFCLHARENQASLRPSDFEISTDKNGKSYIKVSTAFATEKKSTKEALAPHLRK